MNEKKEILTLKILWGAIALGFALFLAVAYFLFVKDANEPAFEEFQAMSYISYLLVIAAIPGGYYIFDKMVKTKPESLNRAMPLYRKALIIKYMIFEFAGFFSVITYMLSSKIGSLYMSAFILVALLINKPSLKAFHNIFNQNKP
ncbi:MAG: hypothetical protein U9N85_11660 [Bacteroidota bacterium]|nr:hypothetical protein [Bacteroidota bacterium]